MNWFKNLIGSNDDSSRVSPQSSPKPSYAEEVVGWVITLEGTVESLSKTDIDKSGRNPKYMSSFTVKNEKANYENCDFELGEKVQFRAKDTQIAQNLDRELKVGDKVQIRTTGTDKNPRVLSVSKISLRD